MFSFILVSAFLFIPAFFAACLWLYFRKSFEKNDVFLEKWYYDRSSIVVLKEFEGGIYGFDSLDEAFLYATSKPMYFRYKKNSNSYEIYGNLLTQTTKKSFLNAFVLGYKDVIIDKTRRRLYQVFVPMLQKVVWITSMHIAHEESKKYAKRIFHP